MKKLYEARDRIEAQLVVDQLAEHRIPAVILGDYLSGAAGELPALIFPAVWVIEDRDLDIARRRLDEFLERSAAGSARPEWRCPSCEALVEGGFEVCWHCGEPRPESP